MRVLRTNVEKPLPAMFDPRQELSLGGPRALQFDGDDDPWHVRQPFEELAEELLCDLSRRRCPPDIQHVVVLLLRSPQRMTRAFNRQTHFIPMPLVPGPRTATAELRGTSFCPNFQPHVRIAA